MKKKLTWLFLILTTLLFAFLFSEFFSNETFYVKSDEIVKPIKKIPKLTLPLLDTVAYDKKINELANNPLPQKPTTKRSKNWKRNNRDNRTETSFTQYLAYKNCLSKCWRNFAI